MLILLAYPISLFFVFFILLRNRKILKNVKNNWRQIVLFLLLNMIIINAFLILHLCQENFIPFWDFGGFWKRSLEFNQMLDRNVFEAVDNLLHSIRYSEYSLVPAMMMSLPSKLLGDSFPRFVLAMFNSFVLPANVILYVFSLMLIDNLSKNKDVLKFLAGIVIAGFGGNLYSMVLGYTGSAGLPFIAAILLLVYAGGFDEFRWSNTIMTGLSMILLLLIRRWFAYWIVGFYFCYCIAYLICEGKSLTKKRFLVQLANMMVCGLIPLTILLVCFMPLFKTIVTYNYAEAYSVAKMGGAAFIIGWFIEYYGFFICFLLVIGFYLGIRNRETRLITLLNIMQTILAIVLFNRVQSFGSHHYYIINIPVMMIAIIGLIQGSVLLSRKLIIVILTLLSGLTLISFSKTVVFGENMNDNVFYKRINRVLPAPFPILRIRNDTDTIRSMAKFLDEVPQEYEYVYTLSSSNAFNDDLLNNAFLPEKLYGVKNLLPASAYDYRDGVPYDFFFYKYIVVADPIQLQFGEEMQKCVSILAEFMLDESRSGDYYKIIREDKLDGDITVKIYERIALVPNDVRREIIEEYKEFYPDRPELYEFELLKE